MYRAADEIEKEKELLIHERGISGMFGIVLFVDFFLFIENSVRLVYLLSWNVACISQEVLSYMQSLPYESPTWLTWI